MQKVVNFGALGLLFFLLTPATWAQDSEEVAKFRRENELLKKEVELLKKEVELLKKESKANSDGSRDSKSEEKPRTKDVEFGFVEYELVKCVRDRKVRNRVTFLFAVRDEFWKANVQTVHGCKALSLTTGDGRPLEGKVVYVSNENVQLTKGEWSKFQVSYDGVDGDINSFEEVTLTMGSQFGFARSPLKFYRIKIEPK